VAPDRDLFANFERMRREMDELFGDVLSPSRRGGFTPAVDVYYVADPPRAVVQADLAGVDPSQVALEVRGRELVIAGRRPPTHRDEQRVYQQLEIGSGAFRRVVALGADVDEERTRATYEDGMLVVELPLVRRAARAVPVRPAPRDGGR
jgi:HSP20 family protein